MLKNKGTFFNKNKKIFYIDISDIRNDEFYNIMIVSRFLKIINRYFLFVLFVFAIQSCEPKEEDIVRQDIRDRIAVSWKCDEKSSVFDKIIKSVYTVDIKKDSITQDMIKIFNFYQLGYDKFVQAKMNENKIVISNQLLDGNIINGTGIVSDNYKQIDWVYYVDDGSGTSIDTCTAIYTLLQK